MDVGLRWHLKACTEIFRSNWLEAERNARESLANTLECGTPIPTALAKLALGHALIGLGKYAEAEEHFRWTQQLARDINSHFFGHHSIVGLAFSALKKEEENDAADLIRSALVLGREQRYFTFQPWQPQTAARLCAFALSKGIETNYVRQFIRKRGLLPISIVEINWPWPIKLYTLGRFAIELDDIPITFGRKTPKKDLALLKLLVAANHKGLSEAKLKDELSPDADGDRASNNLKQSLHRLRELLKDNDAVINNDGTIALNRQKIWVDVWAFDAFCENRETGASDIGGLTERGQQLLLLYPGNFLTEESDLPFLVGERERLRGMFFEQISFIARDLEQANKYSDALTLFQKAIEVDSHFEGFYQGLMRCHLKLNRFADGIATYERLRRVLLSHWKSEPSMASKKLFDALHQATLSD